MLRNVPRHISLKVMVVNRARNCLQHFSHRRVKPLCQNQVCKVSSVSGVSSTIPQMAPTGHREDQARIRRCRTPGGNTFHCCCTVLQCKGAVAIYAALCQKTLLIIAGQHTCSQSEGNTGFPPMQQHPRFQAMPWPAVSPDLNSTPVGLLQERFGQFLHHPLTAMALCLKVQ